jgi:hypothetical protein
MNWIKAEHNPMRGAIESREDFIKRNLEWWKLHRHLERSRRLSYYKRFLSFNNTIAYIKEDMIVGEVGPGPFGGIIESCKLQVNYKVFIDYIMEDLFNLNFISWPIEATYVDAAAEAIPLADNTIDVLLSYNTLDHGWDVFQAIRECARVSKRCFLAFDCRGDNDRQVVMRQDGHDKDHYQLMKIEDVLSFLRREGSDLGHWTASDMKIKHFPLVFISVESNAF